MPDMNDQKASSTDTAEHSSSGTIDPDEIARFSALAAEWWDPTGKFKPLHRLNPVRLAYIRDNLCARFDRDNRSLRSLEGLKILDIGCGGGLVAEPLCRLGARVTGIDASEIDQVRRTTSGLAWKIPGRVGDSPLIGAGTWAGPQVAVSCTGVGECFIRACTARRPVTAPG